MAAPLSWKQTGQLQETKTRDGSASNSHNLHSQAKTTHGYTNVVSGKESFYASNILVAGVSGFGGSQALSLTHLSSFLGLSVNSLGSLA